MAGPIMFAGSFLALLGWGIYNKRRLPPWWPADEPPGLAALRQSLRAMAHDMGEALLPSFRALADAMTHVITEFEKVAAAVAAAFEKEPG